MARLPTIIRNMQQGQMKRLADGGDAVDESISAGLGLKALKVPEQKTGLLPLLHLV